MNESLTTAGDIIKALGGPTAVARLTGKRPQNVVNWRAAGRLPPDTFLIIGDALAKQGKEAPASLWGIKSVVGADE